MFSKILIRLIDQAIFPAIVLLVLRVCTLFLLSQHFGYTLQIDNTGFVYSSPEAYYVLNTYSIFIMVLVLAFGMFYILAKSILFHETHITPMMVSKMFSLRLTSFIQNSFDLYSQATVWLSYLYLMFLVSGIMAFFSLLQPWVFYVSLVFTVMSTVLMIYDIEHEINLHKSTNLSDIDELEEYELDSIVKFDLVSDRIRNNL